jgi:hypothetical protein
MRLCTLCKTLLYRLRLSDSVGRQCGRIGRAIGVREIEEIVMAKVIEFYIPTRFRRPLKAASQVQFGQIVEFCLQPKKSA